MSPPTSSVPERGARSDRRWTLLLVALALAFPLGALLQPWLAPSRSALPVVPRQLHAPLLLVTVPGLRADRVHHLGYERATTPVLDDLAWHGVTVLRGYASSNHAASTAAAILTGQPPSRTGVLPAGGSLTGRAETLAERLAGAGYHTMAFVADPALMQRGLERGFQRFEWAPPGTGSDAILARVQWAIETSPSPNWFVWVDLPDLLRPYGGVALAPGGLAPDMPAHFGARPETIEGVTPAWLAERGWGERELAWMSARYDEALRQLDAALGRLLSALDESMQLHTMTICVTGTRGERLADRPGLAFTHGVDLYEHSIRVPFLFRLPAQQVRGLRLDRFVHSVDLAPTLAELVLKRGPRAEWPAACGRSLFRDMTDNYESNPRVFSEGLHTRGADQGAARPATAARAATVKLIEPRGEEVGPPELYALDDDPAERHDRAPGAPEIVGAMQRHVARWREECSTR